MKVTKDGKVQIGDEDNDLVALLDDLAEALLTSTHGGVPLDPASVTALAIIQTKLATLKVA